MSRTPRQTTETARNNVILFCRIHQLNLSLLYFFMLAAAAAGLAKTDRAQIVYGDDDAYAAHACSWYAMHVVQHTLHIPLDTRPVSCIAHCPLHTANCTWRRSAACRRMAHHANNRPQIYLSQNVCVVRATYIVHAGDGAAQMIKPIRICAVQANLINILTQVYAFACQLYIYISLVGCLGL